MQYADLMLKKHHLLLSMLKIDEENMIILFFQHSLVIRNSKEQHLFEKKIFCRNINLLHSNNNDKKQLTDPKLLTVMHNFVLHKKKQRICF